MGQHPQLTAGVEQAVKELQPGLPDVKFDTHVFQQADFVKLAISNLSESLVLGFLLVVVILMLFLFEWRVALISLLTIPLSLVVTVLVLNWRGATINTMTLAGLVIALGAVVDDAIIDAENIVRRLRESRLSGSGESTASVILHASLEVRSPIVYATLIIVAASIPVFLLTGLTGAFFQPAGGVVHPRDRRLDGGGAHAHAGAVPHPAAQDADRAAYVAGRPLAAAAATPPRCGGSWSGHGGCMPRRPWSRSSASWSAPDSGRACSPPSRSATS